MVHKLIPYKDSLKETKKYKDKFSLPINFGKDMNGTWVIRDLTSIGNMIISGATSTGKSNFLNNVIYSLAEMYSPDELKLVLIDSTLSLFNCIKLPHLLYPLAGDIKEGLTTLEDCLKEIERREREEVQKPRIVIIIDEFSDIMLNEETAEEIIYRIATQGTKTGVYIILSTSTPKPKVFTPILKDLINTRLAGAMVTEKDSIEFLDIKGGSELSGNGDMIYKDKEGLIRVQTPFISSDKEKHILNNFTQAANSFYPQIKKEDSLYKQALKLLREYKKVHPKLISEKLGIGYYRALQLLETIVDENNKRDDLYKDALEIYKENRDISTIDLSKKLKIHYDRAKELIEQLRSKN